MKTRERTGNLAREKDRAPQIGRDVAKPDISRKLERGGQPGQLVEGEAFIGVIGVGLHDVNRREAHVRHATLRPEDHDLVEPRY